MSYLNIPRIHFSGKFFTDPSTVNNDPAHYDPANTNPSPWQTPEGQHRFEFRDCLVTSVLGPNGYVDNDPLIGVPVNANDVLLPARIVDLDVYQQGVTALYGINIKIPLDKNTVFSGSMDMATLNCFWFNAVIPTRSWQDSDYDQDSFGGDMNAAGWFQSVIRVKTSDPIPTASPILSQLLSKTMVIDGEYLLSIRFVLDGYQNTREDNNRLLGRINGAIGPVFPDEPLYNPGQRWLWPRPFTKSDQWFFPSFNRAAFMVDVSRKKLVIDLANSICRQSAGGPPVDLGTLTAYVGLEKHTAVQEIGTVDYSEMAYVNNAHIAELDLTDLQLKLIEKGAVSLSMSRTDLGLNTVLAEAPPKAHVAIEVRPIRMEGEPGTVATTKVYVSSYGVKLTNYPLSVDVISVHGNTPGATVPPIPIYPGNTPQADGALTATISPTDNNGFATLTLKVVKNPGQRTPELDGQLYFVVVYDPKTPHPDWSKPGEPPSLQDQTASVLVFSQHTVNTNPQWEEIRAMLAPYIKLYPAMKNRMDFTDPQTFFTFALNPPWDHAYNDNRVGPLGIKAGALAYYFTFPFEDSRFMPISRDLSQARLMTILHYIKNLQDQQNNNTSEK